MVSDQVVEDVWGYRECKWFFVPSLGMVGGIVLVWDPGKVEVVNSEIEAFSLFICAHLVEEWEWVFTKVYCPTLATGVDIFLEKLDDVKTR